MCKSGVRKSKVKMFMEELLQQTLIRQCFKLLLEHASFVPAMARTTTGEAENFKDEKNPLQLPDQSIP